MRDIGKNILGKKKTFNHYLKQTTMIIIPQSNVDFSDLPKHTLTAIIIGFNFLFLASFCILYYFFIKEGYNGSFWDWTWDDDYRLSQYKCCDWKEIDTYAGYGVPFLWIPIFVFDGLVFLMLLISGIAALITKIERYIKLNF